MKFLKVADLKPAHSTAAEATRICLHNNLPLLERIRSEEAPVSRFLSAHVRCVLRASNAETHRYSKPSLQMDR